MPYSAVTHPWPVPFRKRGTCSSTLAVQMTRVSPNATDLDRSNLTRLASIDSHEAFLSLTNGDCCRAVHYSRN